MTLALDLVVIPNNVDVITNGEQLIARSLLPGFLAACAEFRAEVGRPVYVAEAYRSDAAQHAIFVARYYPVDRKTSIVYQGRYWVKRTGVATAAIPGSDAAKHRLGLALDLWSRIDISFTSPEHLIWVRVAKRHGFTNTGTAFGEPWHQEGKPGVSPAGSTYVPIPSTTTPSEEDDMTPEQDQMLKNVHAALLAGGDGVDSMRLITAQTRDAVTNGAARFALVRAKGRPEVFLSVDRQSLRWLESEKQLADQRFTLKAVGAGDLPVQEVDNLAAFGAIGANERPKTSDNFYASL